jgi:hypothetical protein
MPDPKDNFQVSRFRVFDCLYSAASYASEAAHKTFREKILEFVPRLWMKIKDPETGYEYEFRAGHIFVIDADGERRKLLEPGNGDDREILDIIEVILKAGKDMLEDDYE